MKMKVKLLFHDLKLQYLKVTDVHLSLLILKRISIKNGCKILAQTSNKELKLLFMTQGSTLESESVK